jgi:hypothetical protein
VIERALRQDQVDRHRARPGARDRIKRLPEQAVDQGERHTGLGQGRVVDAHDGHLGPRPGLRRGAPGANQAHLRIEQQLIGPLEPRRPPQRRGHGNSTDRRQPPTSIPNWPLRPRAYRQDVPWARRGPAPCELSRATLKQLSTPARSG